MRLSKPQKKVLGRARNSARPSKGHYKMWVAQRKIDKLRDELKRLKED